MGVKTNLAGITFTAGGKSQAMLVGADMVDIIAEINLAISEAITKLNFLIADVLTPSGTESSNISTINTAITALS